MIGATHRTMVQLRYLEVDGRFIAPPLSLNTIAHSQKSEVCHVNCAGVSYGNVLLLYG